MNKNKNKTTVLILLLLLLSSCLLAIINMLLFTPPSPPLNNQSPTRTSPFHLLQHQRHRCEKSHQYNRLVTKTTMKGITCPIFRDEEGFISEFLAYYQLHGLHHVRLYNDGSTDNSLAELQPWVRSGFVSVVENFTEVFSDVLKQEEQDESTWEWYIKTLNYGDRIAKQYYALNDCKDYAIKNDYDYLFVVDIDEYIIPKSPGVSLMDVVVQQSQNTSNLVFNIFRVNFASTPHILEPIELLTIEAYPYRMAAYGLLNYFRTIQPKLYYHLKKPVDSNYETFIKTCCDLHTCHLNCSDQSPEVLKYLNNVAADGDNKHFLLMHHYARSLEKYDLKQRTWDNYSTMSYSLTEYIDRNFGRTFDDRAGRRYGCAVRGILRNMTKQNEYLRPGDFWYRNVEYNKSVLDERKFKNTSHFAQKPGEEYKNLVEV